MGQSILLLKFLVVDQNIQLINVWLESSETNVLDNALVVMDHLYRTGTVKIWLRRLINQDSDLTLEYSIGRTKVSDNSVQISSLDSLRNDDINRISLSKSEIDDHKSQLTFCDSDIPESMAFKKTLIKEQVDVLNLVEKIYSKRLLLELHGHPNYQLAYEEFSLFGARGSQNNFT